MVTVELNSHSGKIIIEIMHDGNLRGVSCDMDDAISYDRSMIEFGEHDTDLTAFIDAWSDGKLQALIWYYEFKRPIDMVLLAGDFAEHAFPIYMKSRYAFQYVGHHFFMFKKFISGTLSLPEVKSVIDDLNENLSSLPWDKGELAAEKAMKSLVSAVQALGDAVAGGLSAASFLDSSSYFAELAVKFDSGHLAQTPEWELAGTEEKAWQIRRFVDCMEAVQADRPWPPLSATE